MSAASLLAALAGVLAVLGAGQLLAARGTRNPGGLGKGGAAGPRGRSSLATAALRLGARMGRGARRRLGVRAPVGLAHRLAAAGAPAGLGVRELMAAKLAAAVAGGVGVLPLAALAPGRLGFALAVAAPAGGFLSPDWWLARRARARAHLVRRDLPALVDLLRVSVEAGMAPVAALAAVGGRATGPLAAEWGTVGREVALGLPLATALERSERRLPLPEVHALWAALLRAQRHGAPLGETLAAQAREARLVRRRRIEEDAAKAGPKIQLVVALLLVPSVLLLVAAALAAAMLDGRGLP